MAIGNVIAFPGSSAALAQAAAAAAAQAQTARPVQPAPAQRGAEECESCKVDSRDRPLLDSRSQLLAQEAAGEARRLNRLAGQAEASERQQSSEDQRPGELSEQEQEQVAELKRADAEVRRHEQAHAAAGGQYAGSPSYEYTTGPDGKRYATAGQVPIDVTPIANDPGATVDKMEQVRRAALAPAEPSPEDRAIAAKASQEKARAQVELNKQAAEERANPGSTDDSADPATQTAAAVSGQAGLSETPGSRRGQPAFETIDIGSLFGISA